jgi:hypothetical protein
LKMRSQYLPSRWGQFKIVVLAERSPCSVCNVRAMFMRWSILMAIPETDGQKITLRNIRKKSLTVANALHDAQHALS